MKVFWVSFLISTGLVIAVILLAVSARAWLPSASYPVTAVAHVMATGVSGGCVATGVAGGCIALGK